ncbi:hypothetical protein QTP70_034266 [Hemibagrus guttatus]|uniref:ribonuclease H n=1 Tax=Hemibagrus guttatus TaxID=175788 RepID=A0AAE0UI82_9TELE|nr:hypothetical protein QTP70_034266 [Hemibagrus guttatus]
MFMILAYGGSLTYTVSCDGDEPIRVTEGSDVIIEDSNQSTGFQSEHRIPIRAQDSNQSAGFQSEGRIPIRGQDSSQSAGFQSERRILIRAQDSNQRAGFQSEGRIPIRGQDSNQRAGFQSEHRIPIRGQDSSQSAGFQSERRIPIRGQDSNQRAGFQSEGRIPIRAQDSNQRAGFQSERRILIRGQDSNQRAGFQSEGRILIRGQDSNQSAGFQSERRIPVRAQDSNQRAGFQSEGRIPIRAQDSNQSAGFQSEHRIPIRAQDSNQSAGFQGQDSNQSAGFQSEGRIPIRGQDSSQSAGFQSERRILIRAQDSNQRAGFQSEGRIPIRGQDSNQRAGFQSEHRIPIRGQDSSQSAGFQSERRIPIRGQDSNQRAGFQSEGRIPIRAQDSNQRAGFQSERRILIRGQDSNQRAGFQSEGRILIRGQDSNQSAGFQSERRIPGGGLRLTDVRSDVYSGPQLAGVVRRRVSLTPESFRHLDSNALVSKSDIIRVLLSLTHIRLRAAHCQQHSLSSVSMEVASADSHSGVQARAVETCAEGYRRVNGTLHQGVCELCHCHGHASHCDDITGHCLECKHHTTGLNCDVCTPGYYGDATRGTPDDCQPCACPLQTPSNNPGGQQNRAAEHSTAPSTEAKEREATPQYSLPPPPPPPFLINCPSQECNSFFLLFLFSVMAYTQKQHSFSPTCHQDKDGQLVCDRCRVGYTGPRCDRCDNGYFGSPGVVGGSCRLCDCSGNLDLSVPRSCDPVTGACLRCRDGYAGPNCETCADSYYGDAIVAKDCQLCGCNINGSVSEVCNKETGQCQCHQNVLGRVCDECTETRWKGSKARSIGAGFKLFYYGVDSKRNGVGVVLKEEFVRNVLEVKRVSDRVMSLKLEIEGVMLNVVSGYAPQVGCELEEKERFWSELDEVMESIPTGERVVIGADFNGHVGEGNTGDEEVMGKFGVKERNLEGQMVVDFAKRMDMGVVNTYFQRREEHRVTYKSGGRRTQVDYILCRRGNLKEISDCKVVVGESVARQHRMVVCRMTLMVCKTKRSKIEKKTKWWKLKKEECCEEFRQKLRQALGGQVVLPDDWETTAEVIRETGRKVLGVSSGRRKEDKETWWWNEEVQDSIQRKRLAKKKWEMDRTEENRQEYKELQRRVKREVSKAKQKAYEELYTRLDTREGEKDLYRLARQRDGDGKDVQQVRVIKDRDGRVLTSEESVQRRWKEYFEELMNEENEREKRVEGVNSVEQKVDKIRKDEVRKTLKRMKSGKAVGPDDIPVEVWKCLGEAAVEFLANLFNRVLESERMPEEWRRSVLVPIFKNKGDVQSCSNYRGIKLMSHTMKVWERVVEARLRKVVEICEQQYGFMPRKSTTDAIFALRILMEKYRDGQKELHFVFVDLEKAYDRVPREELWYCMRKSGVAEKYVRVVQDMYERSRTVVRCAVGQTEEFNVEVGLHQGSALSPFLFAIVMDQLSEEVRQESPWTMMFADDIVICSESREQVEENLERWRFALERRGMKVSRSKTEYMCVNEREGSGTVRLQGEEVKKVQEFKYLGSTVQSNGECGKEPGTHLQPGSGCVPCHCNSFGSKSFDCSESGQCRCQPGVTGQKCDRCAPGQFNFQEGGCTPCECSHVGNNCDPGTGRCLCPPNTVGDRCEKCAPNHWGHDIATGCKACGCNMMGAVTQQCNVNTGCCFCRDQFTGEKCNECKLGYRNFPHCVSCDCSLPGSNAETCNAEEGVCACAERTGQCSCKLNVEGLRCEVCKVGTFGLSVRNPLGCSRCYCFGLSTSCTEAQGLIRMRLTLMPEQKVLSLVDKDNTKEITFGVTFQYPEIIANAEVIRQELAEPYYWKLPKQFRGSMITAYGGKLKYTIYYEARDETGHTSYEPQVIIRGGANRDKVMVRHMVEPQIGQLTRHEIDMTEHEWKHQDNKPMTREDFMDVLFYVDYVFIRASHGNVLRQSRISEISLQVAEEGRPSVESERAHQIEKCECPQGYSGLSCEVLSVRLGSTGCPRVSLAPGSGQGWAAVFGVSVMATALPVTRTPVSVRTVSTTQKERSVRDVLLVITVWYVALLMTANAALVLSPTLRIIFYACLRLSFSPTCVTEGFNDYRCTACPEGYTGKYCERCATGYHGDPRRPGGRCEECECDPVGAMPVPCDTHTGACQCRPGATGLKCDRCMEKHVCGPAGIVSCDDDCAGLLIRDMDQLLRLISGANLTLPLPPPYGALYRVENMTDELKHMLSPHRAPERLLQLADSNLGSLVTEMDELLSRATKVSADGEQTDSDAERSHKRAEDLELFVKNTLLAAEALRDKARELNATLGRRDGGVEKSVNEMQDEIKAMITELRARQLTHPHTHTVQDELRAAQDLLLKVQRSFVSPHRVSEELQQEVDTKLRDHHHKLDRAQELLDEAQGKTGQARTLNSDNLHRLEELRRKRNENNKKRKETERVLDDGEKILNEANAHSDSINRGFEETEEMERELEPLQDQLDYRVSKLARVMEDDTLPELLLRAENHARQLNDSASILDSILAEAKNLSFNATAAFNAYSNIKNYIEEADKAAKQARDTATQAVQLATGPKGALKDEAKGSVQKSQRLWNEAKSLENVVKENGDNLGVLQLRLKGADAKNKELLKGLNENLAVLRAIPNDTAAKLQATKQKAGNANNTALEVLARLKDMNQNLMGLNRNYSKLKDDISKANNLIQDPEKNIHAAGAKVKDLEDEAERLLEKLKPIQELQDNLRKNISQIKELINQARKQANSIKVSVSSGGDCIRTYRPDIKKGRYNTIILNVKTLAADNLLFYLGSAKFVDFLAIEMRKGKVNFLWDVGSGVGRVEYPDLTINDGNWHRIEAFTVHTHTHTVGLNGSISVRSLEGPKAGIVPTWQSARSPESYTVLDVDQNAYLFVGGMLGSVKKADAVKTITFSGCMGETYLDNKPIGLWNYKERDGDCKGCVVSPQPADSEAVVQFDGDGYAAVSRPVRWNPNSSTVTFKFRTFSTSAVMMYLATKDMKDFMSIELSEGRVKASYDLGSGTGSALSQKRHNDGRWKSLTMTRSKKQATVLILDMDTNEEEKLSIHSQGGATGLNLKEDERIYFAGLPTIGNYRPEVTLRRYAGCMKDIEVSRTPYNILSSPDYTGLTKGCSIENIHTVSFPRPGFMELSPMVFDVGSEITLSFSTKNENGIILYGRGGVTTLTHLTQSTQNIPNHNRFQNPGRKRRQTGEPYVSVQLNKGALEVLVFSSGRNPRRTIRKLDGGILHDGLEHSLRLRRHSGGLFSVQVDEEERLEQALPNDQPIIIQRLFVGGVPADMAGGLQRPGLPFEGCIWNLLINTIPMDFSQPVAFENAEIGQCPDLAPPPPPPAPEEEEEEEKEVTPPKIPVVRPPLLPPSTVSCVAEAESEVLQLAKQFGLSRNSHMAFEFDDRKVKNSLILEFELRTEAESGLVFYMARINHADFATVQVKEGMAHLSYDLGSGNTSVSVPRIINDGHWHKIKVRRDKQRGILTVDSRYIKHTISPKKADILDVVGTLYVGGLPLNYTTKRIGPVVYSINGCIRNFRMTNGPQDLENPSSSYRVGSCFTKTQSGSYFSGTGFAKAVSTYRVGNDVTVELQFRTSTSTGVLFGISSQVMDGLGLELLNGRLLFHADNGVGRVTAMSQGAELCDGQWHSVTAHKLKHRLELIVDGRKSEAASPDASSASADTNDPVYVGGYPEGLKQFGLTINTPFKGCMRNIKLIKAGKVLEVHLNKALELKGVQPLTCPAA